MKLFRSLFITGIMMLISGSLTGQVGKVIFDTATSCLACHNQLSDRKGHNISIGDNWRPSMMANSARDPYWQASVRREILAHPTAEGVIQNECSACHMPMSRYLANSRGEQGKVFRHLPGYYRSDKNADLANDGVSCLLCHQITAKGLGNPESFTAGFHIDSVEEGARPRVYGPYDIDEGRKNLMVSATGFSPHPAKHLRGSELCATCHTLITHTLDDQGQVIGELPEQVPYLEWKHSAYFRRRDCQSCHMPEAAGENRISAVLGLEHQNVSRHIFRGGNFLMPLILNRHRKSLGVAALPSELESVSMETTRNLRQRTAGLKMIGVERRSGRLDIEIGIQNLAGHKLPTAYPSRRVWVHLLVEDIGGKVLFESGAMRKDGSIRGNDNDENPESYEPHYTVIEKQDQVQIYEAIMGDFQDRVTTTLLSGLRYIKDNRLLPQGFDKRTAEKEYQVWGHARRDSDFQGSGDRLRYRIPLADDETAVQITATLWYQPIGYRWAENMEDFPSREGARFLGYFREVSEDSRRMISRVSRVAE